MTKAINKGWRLDCSPAIKPVLQEVKQCFLHHIGYLRLRTRERQRGQEEQGRERGEGRKQEEKEGKERWIRKNRVGGREVKKNTDMVYEHREREGENIYWLSLYHYYTFRFIRYRAVRKYTFYGKGGELSVLFFILTHTAEGLCIVHLYICLQRAWVLSTEWILVTLNKVINTYNDKCHKGKFTGDELGQSHGPVTSTAFMM